MKAIIALGVLVVVPFLFVDHVGATPAEVEVSTLQGDDFVLGAEDKAELQRRVDEVVDANPGSRQINQNEIELTQGALVTVPLPGETIVRAPGQVVTPGAPNCPYQYLCLYEDPNYEGDRFAVYGCGYYNLLASNWDNKISSWINNQSGGVVWAYDWGYWPYMFIIPVGSRSVLGWVEDDRIDAIRTCA